MRQKSGHFNLILIGDVSWCIVDFSGEGGVVTT